MSTGGYASRAVGALACLLAFSSAATGLTACARSALAYLLAFSSAATGLTACARSALAILISACVAATGLTACATTRTQQARPQPVAVVGELRNDPGAVLVPRDLYPIDGETKWVVTDDEWMRIEDGERVGTLVRTGDAIEWREPLGTTTESLIDATAVRLRRTIASLRRASSMLRKACSNMDAVPHGCVMFFATTHWSNCSAVR